MYKNIEKKDPHGVDATRRAERTLLARVAQTKRTIRRVDLVSALCAYATLGLALLLLGVLLDHWILAKGLTARGRLYFAVFWCVATCAFLVAKLIPVVRRKVNALYAAKTLEDSSPNGRNLIINWFLLRRDDAIRRETHENDENSAMQDATLQIVALQASEQSQKIAVETPVDFAPIIRWGIALVVVVAVCALYAVLSPKNLFISVGRIAAPFAHIDRPQALHVEKTSPGNAVVYQGDFVEIEATIPGSSESSNVEVLYSAEDGRYTELAAPMESIGASQFKLKFPDSENGLQESLYYCVVVARGTLFESRSETFLLEARPEPSFQPEKTTLIFPEYSGLPPQTFDRQGEVRALENTKVELVARSNQPLKRAFLLPNGERPQAVSMTIDSDDPTLATADFQLQWKNPNADEKIPQISFYQLASINENDESNRDVNNYAVSIISDLPPTINWSEEAEEKINAPLNDVLSVRFTAEDPDYSLRRVQLRASFANLEQGEKVESKKNPEPIDLKLRGAEPNHDYSTGATPFVGVQKVGYDLVPEKLGFSVGDEIEYWGVAYDSKLPEPNVVASEKRVFVVVEPIDNPRIPQENAGQEDQNQETDDGQQGNEQQNGSESGNEGQDGEQSKDHQDDSSQEGHDSGDGQEQQSGTDSGNEGQDGGQSNVLQEEGAQEDQASNDSQNQEDSQQNGVESENESQDDGQSSELRNQTEGHDSEYGASSPSSNEESGNESSERQTGGANPTNSSNKGNDESSNGEAVGETNEPSDSGKEGEKSNSSATANDEGVETSQQDAFEKILNYMERERSDNSIEREGNSKGDEEFNGGQGSSNRDNKASSNERDGAREAQDEVKPNFESDVNLPTPREKRNLPTRTSSEKPSENADIFQADNPEKLDPNTRRQETDEIDSTSNNFLGQNADPDAQTSNNVDARNQNVVMDPLDQSQSVAADSIDPNASEAKGANVNDAPNAPSEIDPSDARAGGKTAQAPEKEGRPNAPSDVAQSDEDAQHPTTADLNQAQTGAGNAASQDEETRGDAPSQAPNKRNSDQNARSQGGGGGSGTGEIASDEHSLAPADAPKLLYAEKATNLALEFLEETQNTTSRRQLLAELGWTDEQLREFIKQWRKMRDDALGGDKPDAKRKYFQSLEKLRFSDEAKNYLDSSISVDSTIERDDDHRNPEGSKEAIKVKTPKRLEERVRAFTRGVAKTTRSND